MQAVSAPKRRALTDDDAVVLYRWLTTPRIIATGVSGLAIIAFWLTHVIAFDPRILLFVVIPAFVLASGWIAVRIERKRGAVRLLYAQLGLDVLVVAAGSALTGGVHSPFVPLYYIVIISAGIVSLEATLAVGAAALALYWTEAGLDLLGRLPTVSGLSETIGKDDLIGATIFLLVIGLIAFQSWFYSSRIREKDEELLKLKDEFLFRTIHDLRSPSTVIRIILEKYGEPGRPAPDPEFKGDVELVRGALSRMTALIEDLLKIGRGESVGFALKKEPVDVPAVVKGVVAELAPVMAKKNVRAEIGPSEGLPSAVGDAEKLKEVFNNFVDNAVKYNKEGGAIFISYRSEKGMVAVEFRDTGIGISEKSLAGLFAPYFRGDIGREIQGTGLGLYMTKRLVEKMGGKITAASKKGEGSTFTVRLPTA